MKPARIIILAVAVGAAGLAGLIAMRMTGTKQVVMQQAETIVQKEPTVRVLVSAENLPVGSRLNDKAVRWADWPETALVDGFITDRAMPDAVRDVTGSVVRMPLFAGEPVRREKIADAKTNIMSALLPAGKRAVATEISVSTGAGGFILPNDRVDIIMVRQAAGRGYTTEVVLENIRVLAIDQQIQERDDGVKAVVGTTATLELTPDQAKVMSVAQQMADRLTLSLRSIADAQEEDTRSADYLLSGGTNAPAIQLIKSGEIVTSTTSAGGSPATQAAGASAGGVQDGTEMR
ncbi:Flp pilus assembly protein CpaB [Rhizobiaceae bacterium BDR2-2]|uniref:Flp pilus assembly protein CpaB n=1 Tax=Ectorhizobium quercum TaxID=2965071 RepID=A0AAE3MWQ0_9HYPH|nr:Flp pilus assembly protein CpaB [Ectorhizobium quercum]MCX8995686.1 Flp pilus assembly protein CpaB [Ectorhizobium quercum]